MSRFAVLWLLPIVAVTYLVRTVLVVTFRQRAPRVAHAVDRWWTWVPLAIVVLALWWVHPVVGLVVTVATFVALSSSRATGSPLRPRR